MIYSRQGRIVCKVKRTGSVLKKGTATDSDNSGTSVKRQEAKHSVSSDFGQDAQQNMTFIQPMMETMTFSEGGVHSQQSNLDNRKSLVRVC